ncbi:MAG: S41 family peptidase [Gemmatimonadota bacterium]|nr:S41 family peptidase [Gemmatimonadota bacterium]
MTENERRTESPAYHAILRCLLFILALCLIIAPSAWGDYQDGRTAYNRGDYATALKELRPLAEQGHAGAQYFIGYMYYKGQGVDQDGEEAVKWLRKAAEQGDVKAQYLLGYMCYKGQGVGQDSEEAQKWLRKAAEQGHAKAQFYLGEMYYKVKTVGQDEEEAVKWVHKAAEQGLDRAQYLLGHMYYKGWGVERDREEAVKWVRKAAEQDYEQAQHILPMLLNETQVDSDPEKNLQILWNEFDRHYVFFLSKNVNWQALYDIYAPQVTDQTDNAELFAILSSMLTHLNDVHVTLTMPFKNFNSANRRPGGTLNLDFVKRKYLNAGFQTTGNGLFTSGQIFDAIGYLHIASFSSKNGRAWVEAIDPIVSEFFDHKGLIVDVRGNNGGSSRNVDAIVGRFADQKRVSALVQRRDGSRHSDFGRITKKYVKPAGDKQFTKSIIVLTDRQVISSGEYFVLAMKQFPYVRTVGDTTFGGQGSPTRKKLPNGWEYKVSTGKWSSADNVLYEDIGVPPDIPVAVSPSDSVMGRDSVIEMAIQLLK